MEKNLNKKNTQNTIQCKRSDLMSKINGRRGFHADERRGLKKRKNGKRNALTDLFNIFRLNWIEQLLAWYRFRYFKIQHTFMYRARKHTMRTGWLIGAEPGQCEREKGRNACSRKQSACSFVSHRPYVFNALLPRYMYNRRFELGVCVCYVRCMDKRRHKPKLVPCRSFKPISLEFIVCHFIVDAVARCVSSWCRCRCRRQHDTVGLIHAQLDYKKTNLQTKDEEKKTKVKLTNYDKCTHTRSAPKCDSVKKNSVSRACSRRLMWP